MAVFRSSRSLLQNAAAVSARRALLAREAVHSSRSLLQNAAECCRMLKQLQREGALGIFATVVAARGSSLSNDSAQQLSLKKN